jgi:predicted lipoprotein with Yx(FWY)xxD motif
MMRRVTRLFAGSAVLVLLAAAIGVAAYGAAYTVDTAKIMVKGASTRVLTDAKGMTLYYVATDTPTSSSCTGGCAKIWPPLLSTSAPSTEEALPGKLAVVKTANGSQVSYNGHLLYTYSGDTAPKQANGQGVAGKWWVASVNVKPAAASGTTPPKKTGYGDGGY